MSTFVLAAGSSSGNARVSPTTADRVAESTVSTCEDKETVRDRIKCRIENPQVARAEAYDAVEEACRDSYKKDACERLYKSSAYCYDQTDPAEKKRCFLKESGVNINSKGTFRAAPDETKRNYVVLLFYELQERIEKMQEEGKITADQATSLITKIVEIKKMIIAGEKREDIVVKIIDFKKEYRSVVSSFIPGVANDS